MLNEDGYPLSKEDFYSYAEFEDHFTEAESAIDEMIWAVEHENLNATQQKAIKHYLDGASGAIYQAREKFEEILDAMIIASEAEFEAQQAGEEAGV